LFSKRTLAALTESLQLSVTEKTVSREHSEKKMMPKPMPTLLKGRREGVSENVHDQQSAAGLTVRLCEEQ
jgi:hypothetical protein